MKKVAVFAVSFFASVVTLHAWGPFGPKVKFEHVVPPPHHIPGVERIVVAQYSTYDPLGSESVMQSMIWRAKEHRFEIVDATDNRVRLADLRGGKGTTKKFLDDFAADAYMSIDVRNCNSRINSESVKKKKKDGEVTVNEYWGVASCAADLRIVDPSGEELASFSVVGDGESTRNESRGSYLENTALTNALSEAAAEAVAKFVPRRVEVSIGLEKKAPGFKEGFEKVKVDRLQDARSVWETTLASNAGSAPLHFNLAAVTEALGDYDAATTHYAEAARLAPGEKKFRRAVDDFEKRNRDRAEMAREE